MAQVIVRNLGDEVVAALKARARRSGVSLEHELRRVLTEAAAQPPAEKLALADRIRRLTKTAKLPDSTTMIREDRDRR